MNRADLVSKADEAARILGELLRAIVSDATVSQGVADVAANAFVEARNLREQLKGVKSHDR